MIIFVIIFKMQIIMILVSKFDKKSINKTKLVNISEFLLLRFKNN